MSAKPKVAGEKKKPPMAVILGITALVAGLGIGKYAMGSKKVIIRESDKPKVVSYLALDDFTVNLDGNGDHYLKATISLGLDNKITEEDAKAKIAPIRDAILTILSKQTYSGLAHVSAREKVKDQIQSGVDDALGEKDIAAVYFTSFATQ